MKKIESVIPFFKGYVLAFGIEEESILKAIEKNKKIVACDLLDSKVGNKEKGKSKKISRRKIKKELGKNKVDIILVNDKNIEEQEASMIPFFMYLLKDKLYVYHIHNKTKTIKRYKRYKVKIKEEEGYLEIEKTNYQMPKIKEKYYKIIDKVLDILDNITDLLTS